MEINLLLSYSLIHKRAFLAILNSFLKFPCEGES